MLAKGAMRGATYTALAADSPPPADGRRFGDVLLRGRGAGTSGRYIYVRFDTTVPAMAIGSNWLWSNSIAVNVATATVEGEQRAAWVQAFAATLARHPQFLWGAAYVGGEFAADNLDDSSGLRAIGRDVSRHLPGVYWLNLFGEPYVDLIGLERALTAPAAEVQRVGPTTLVRAYDRPEEWRGRLPDKQRLRCHPGDDLFFDRNDPLRETRAPHFGLTPLVHHPPPFQVVTGDGGTSRRSHGSTGSPAPTGPLGVARESARRSPDRVRALVPQVPALSGVDPAATAWADRLRHLRPSGTSRRVVDVVLTVSVGGGVTTTPRGPAAPPPRVSAGAVCRSAG